MNASRSRSSEGRSWGGPALFVWTEEPRCWVTGFVEEPETNGVVERSNRTLKEQAIYGRVFGTLDDVRVAVAAFVERYNQSWRLEKLAYRTPIEAREEYELRPAA